MTSQDPAGPGTRAGATLVALFLANTLSWGDRALLGVVVDPIKRDLLLSDTQMSLLNGAIFIAFNLVAGVAISHWVDRGNRKFILLVGVAIWSIATAFIGAATGFASLATALVLVGVGEATVFPVALSMIGDLRVPAERPRAVAMFQAGTFVGLVGGSILAGVLAAAHGWRWMFVMCGVGGLVLMVAMVFAVRDPARRTDGLSLDATADGDARGAIGRVLTTPGFVPLSLGIGFLGTVGAVLGAWGPAFLQRSHHVPLAEVGAVIGPAVGISGIAGTVIGGVLATLLVRRRGSARAGLLVPLIATPLATPFLALFVFAPTLTGAMTATAMMTFLISLGVAPCFALGSDMVSHRVRALASTLMLFAFGLIGSAMAPFVVGLVSDVLAPGYGTESLRYGLATMIVTPAVATLLLLFAYRRLTDLAPRLRDPATAAVFH
ncbi:MFS transporter [Sphingomonas panacis]|uniref:MFS transporter n=1 Tax=Sphingomonas panacis TaxID=1560345 RepID=A0A1B3ZC12_9SPHN|nr:MFS transporter [Sphingomonas panacis]AOH84976.1 MFS transporter [Sphingomonas panacis]